MVNGDKYVKANFAVIPQYTLTTSVTPSDGGSVTLNPSGGTYDENTGVTVTAVAATGFAFKNWAGDLSGTTNPTTVTMTGDKVVEAVFEPAQSCTTVNLVATADNYMSAGNMQYNNGGTDDIHVDNTTGTARRGALLKWDLSCIPSNASVSSATIYGVCYRRKSPGVQPVQHAASLGGRYQRPDQLDYQLQLEHLRWFRHLGVRWRSRHDLRPIRYKPVGCRHNNILHNWQQDSRPEHRWQGRCSRMDRRIRHQLRSDHAELLGDYQQRRVLLIQ